MVGRVISETSLLEKAKPVAQVQTAAQLPEPVAQSNRVINCVEPAPKNTRRNNKLCSELEKLEFEVGLRIRILREAAKLSRPKLAEQLGIPPTTLKNYELQYRATGLGIVIKMTALPMFSRYTSWLLHNDVSVLHSGLDTLDIKSKLEQK